MKGEEIIKYSVLISLYRKESSAYLKEALESVFAQTVNPDEVVIVYDGPLTNELYDSMMIFRNQYPGIKIVELKENVGLGMALASGLQHCSYEIVARMDTDDICVSDRFEKQLDYLSEYPDVTLIGGAIEEFKEQPGDLKRNRKLPLSWEEIRKMSYSRNPLNHQTVMFRKSDVLSVGSYEGMLYFEDYYLWLKLLSSNKKIFNLPDTLVHARVGNDMIGKRHGFNYLKKELHFLSSARRNGYIPYFIYIKLAVIRLPLRLLPKGVLHFIYKKILRKN